MNAFSYMSFANPGFVVDSAIMGSLLRITSGGPEVRLTSGSPEVRITSGSPEVRLTNSA